jgi:hypothetical protein
MCTDHFSIPENTLGIFTNTTFSINVFETQASQHRNDVSNLPTRSTKLCPLSTVFECLFTDPSNSGSAQEDDRKTMGKHGDKCCQPKDLGDRGSD